MMFNCTNLFISFLWAIKLSLLEGMLHWAYNIIISGVLFYLMFEKYWVQQQMSSERSVSREGFDACGISLWLGYYFLFLFFFCLTNTVIFFFMRLKEEWEERHSPGDFLIVLHYHTESSQVGLSKDQKAEEVPAYYKAVRLTPCLCAGCTHSLHCSISVWELPSQAWEGWLPEMIF